MTEEDFIAKFENEHGWTPDCAYETRQFCPPVDVIGEENIGGKSVKLSDFELQVKDLTVGDAIELNRLTKIEEDYLQKQSYEL